MNTSTLHHYCTGDAVPLDFAPVERFAALCGASAEQRLELHRRWLLAVAARHRPRTGVATQDAPDTTTAQPVDDPAEEPAPVGEGTIGRDAAPRADGCPAVTPDAALKVTSRPVTQTDAARRSWCRRGRVVASLACG